MNTHKKYNFSAGPAMLPPEVLQQAQQELLNWQGLEFSVLEISHRSKEFIQLAADSIADLTKLLNIPPNYKVLFSSGGGRGQFAAIPMNILAKDERALYLDSGHWSHLASLEAQKYGNIDTVELLSKDSNGNININNLDFSASANQYKYVYFCGNETISGIEIAEPPKVDNSILVADMSSNFCSRVIDVSKYGLIYAGAQKNIGPAGITLIIIREDLIGHTNAIVPAIFDYQLLLKHDSMYNTPAVFSWYFCGLVFKWLLAQGGIAGIEQRNKLKSSTLYSFIDNSNGFYQNKVDPKYRSRMNVTFTTGDAELDKQFVQQATAAGLCSLNGHPVLGGMRASIYNAMPLEGVHALINFMQQFQQNNKQ